MEDQPDFMVRLDHSVLLKQYELVLKENDNLKQRLLDLSMEISTLRMLYRKVEETKEKWAYYHANKNRIKSKAAKDATWSSVKHQSDQEFHDKRKE